MKFNFTILSEIQFRQFTYIVECRRKFRHAGSKSEYPFFSNPSTQQQHPLSVGHVGPSQIVIESWIVRPKERGFKTLVWKRLRRRAMVADGSATIVWRWINEKVCVDDFCDGDRVLWIQGALVLPRIWFCCRFGNGLLNSG